MGAYLKHYSNVIYCLHESLTACVIYANHLIVCSTDWEMRLVNGGSSLEGRLEVCLNGVWGTICDQSWDDTDAGVVCSQMGHSARGKNLLVTIKQQLILCDYRFSCSSLSLL